MPILNDLSVLMKMSRISPTTLSQLRDIPVIQLKEITQWRGSRPYKSISKWKLKSHILSALTDEASEIHGGQNSVCTSEVTHAVHIGFK